MDPHDFISSSPKLRPYTNWTSEEPIERPQSPIQDIVKEHRRRRSIHKEQKGQKPLDEEKTEEKSRKGEYKRVTSAYGHINGHILQRTRIKRSVTLSAEEFEPSEELLALIEKSKASDESSDEEDTDSALEDTDSKKSSKKKDKKKKKELKKDKKKLKNKAEEDKLKRLDRKKKSISLSFENAETKNILVKLKKDRKKGGSLKLDLKNGSVEKSYHPKYHKYHNVKLEKWQESELLILSNGSFTPRWEIHQAKIASRFVEDSQQTVTPRRSKKGGSNSTSTGKEDSEVEVVHSDTPPDVQNKPKSIKNTSTNKAQVKLELEDDPRASLFEVEDSNDNLRLVDINGVSSIAAATVEKLIQKLTDAVMYTGKSASYIYSYPAYLHCFMLTYRQFLSPRELMELLKLRWNCHPPPGQDIETFKTTRLLPIRLRVLNIIKLWIIQCYSDIKEDQETHDLLISFLDKIQGFNTIIESIKKELHLKMEGIDRELIEYSMDPPAIYPVPDAFSLDSSVLEIHPEEFARQISLVEHSLFRNIRFRELLAVRWTKSSKHTESPNVLAMISFTNNFVNWVVTEILKCEDLKTRSVTISRFVTIAKICVKQYNNFNAAMEILSALRSSSIFRLKNSWSLIPNNIWDDFEEIVTLFESDSNYKTYRNALECVVPPCVPYLGRYLSELLFINEKYGDKIPDTNLINFGKMYLISEAISQIQMFQSAPYCLKAIPEIQVFFANKEALDQKEAYKRSLILEPRESMIDERHSVA